MMPCDVDGCNQEVHSTISEVRGPSGVKQSIDVCKKHVFKMLENNTEYDTDE